MTYFSNPLLLVQMRPQIEASVARTPGGLLVLRGLFAAVRTSLAHGLERVFFWSAIIMTRRSCFTWFFAANRCGRRWRSTEPAMH